MPLEIEVLTGPLKGKRLKLPTGIHTVGRGLGPLPFQDLGLSQEHAKLHVFAHRIEVEDIGSTNGTFVNGSRVARQVLKDGDEVRLGPESTFRVMGDEKINQREPRPLPSSDAAPARAPITVPQGPPLKVGAQQLTSATPRFQTPRKESINMMVRAAFIIALVAGGGLLVYALKLLFAV